MGDASKIPLFYGHFSHLKSPKKSIRPNLRTVPWPPWLSLPCIARPRVIWVVPTLHVKPPPRRWRVPWRCRPRVSGVGKTRWPRGFFGRFLLNPTVQQNPRGWVLPLRSCRRSKTRGDWRSKEPKEPDPCSPLSKEGSTRWWNQSGRPAQYWLGSWYTKCGRPWVSPNKNEEIASLTACRFELKNVGLFPCFVCFRVWTDSFRGGNSWKSHGKTAGKAPFFCESAPYCRNPPTNPQEV